MRIAVLSLLLLPYFCHAAAQGLGDPTNTAGYLRSGNDLIFCVDKQNPIWAFEQDMGSAIAHALGRKASFYVHRSALPIDTIAQPIDPTEILRLFAHYCDVYPGLIGSTTPAFDYPADEQVSASKAYLKVSYVFVSRDATIRSINALPKSVPLSLQLNGVPEYFMYTLRKGRFTGRPVITAARLANDLALGKAKSALIFAPQLFSAYPAPGKVGLYVSGVTELPNMSWYVIAGVRRDRPTLRQQVDSAVSRLLQNGTVARLLKKHQLDNGFIRPAQISDSRPASESFRDK